MLIPIAFQIFDDRWHKLHFGVSRTEVMLYVDCDLISTFQLEPVGPIDVNGDIVIAKASNSARTMPVSAPPDDGDNGWATRN